MSLHTKAKTKRSLWFSILLAVLLLISANNTAVESPYTDLQGNLKNDKKSQQPEMMVAVEELIRFLNESELQLYASGMPPNSSIFEQAEIMGGGKVGKEGGSADNACSAAATFFANPRQALLYQEAKMFQDLVHFFEG